MYRDDCEDVDASIIEKYYGFGMGKKEQGEDDDEQNSDDSDSGSDDGSLDDVDLSGMLWSGPL